MSVFGIILTGMAIIFCTTVFMAIDKNSHSVSDTLYGIFPYFVSVFTLLVLGCIEFFRKELLVFLVTLEKSTDLTIKDSEILRNQCVNQSNYLPDWGVFYLFYGFFTMV